MSHYHKQQQREEMEMAKENTFNIKPNPKTLLVWDEFTQVPLKSSGENKPRSEYWLRRLADGDVVEITETTKKKDK